MRDVLLNRNLLFVKHNLWVHVQHRARRRADRAPSETTGLSPILTPCCPGSTFHIMLHMKIQEGKLEMAKLMQHAANTECELEHSEHSLYPLS